MSSLVDDSCSAELASAVASAEFASPDFAVKCKSIIDDLGLDDPRIESACIPVRSIERDEHLDSVIGIEDLGMAKQILILISEHPFFFDHLYHSFFFRSLISFV